MLLKVHDVLRLPKSGGGFRVWKITSINLGDERQENVIGLKSIDLNDATTVKPGQKELFVPEAILIAAKPEKV